MNHVRVGQASAEDRLVSDGIEDRLLDAGRVGDVQLMAQEQVMGVHADVVDADLSKYFDTIPHPKLMQCVAGRISDRDVLSLIKQWLKAPVRSNDENGKDQMSGGRKSQRGTPQGGVISPLLANLYMIS